MLRGRPSVCARLQAESPDDVAVASMTEAELRYGALRSKEPERGRAQVEAFLSAPFEILPFDRDAARCHADLRFSLRTQPVGERDLVIASVAVTHRCVLVTGNAREFARVPGLNIESWVAD